MSFRHGLEKIPDMSPTLPRKAAKQRKTLLTLKIMLKHEIC